jgi:beta-glucosidase
VKAGARTVMVNSAEVNGIPGHVNSHLLTEVLRGELGFQGVVVSDWEDIKKLVNIHRIAADEADATRQAVLAGIDMSMVPSDYSFSDLLLALVQEKKVPISRINEAVRRILTLKYELGLFDDPLLGIGNPVPAPGASDAALAAARESIILLKNRADVLPLRKDQRILLTGPAADSMSALNNGWSYVWQGDRKALYPERMTVLAAMRAVQPNLQYVPGTEFEKEIDVAATVQAAANVDVIVAAIGEASYTETPGNIDDLTLPAAQLRLVEQLAATGKPLVLVLLEGRPRIISSIADRAHGIVLGLNPGNFGGRAVADVLFGEINPSGRLPITYPKAPNALLTYDHKAYEGTDTNFGLKPFQSQFSFGAGLSYTNFEYADLTVTPGTAAVGEPIRCSVRVRNTGKRAGKAVVQLYVTDKVASMTPPGKRLRRFAKADLEPGASEILTFNLGREDFSFIGRNAKPVVEPGEFEITIGELSRTIKLASPVKRSDSSPPRSN